MNSTTDELGLLVMDLGGWVLFSWLVSQGRWVDWRGSL